MKLLVWGIFSLAYLPAIAQRLNGKVVDRITHLPVAQASVSTHLTSTHTNADGVFSIFIEKADTLRISFIGYKTYKAAIKPQTDTLTISMAQLSILLEDARVLARRDYKKDSLRNRRIFSSVYNYRPATVADAFTKKAVLAYTPSDNITALNSTTSLVGVDVLSVIGLLGEKHHTTVKLQKVLLADEEAGYIDRRFSLQKVGATAALKGDSLLQFMAKYRPTVVMLKNMTDYELALYIKNRRRQFAP